jgi:hypothetical protein
MMVPMDGKNFFANDVMHSAFSSATNGNGNAAADDSPDSDGVAPAVSATKAFVEEAVTEDWERLQMDGTKRLYRPKSVLLVPLANTPVGGSGRVAGGEERS